MTDQLPEVGSVWRHNETGEVRVVVPGDDDSADVVHFLKAGSEERHCVSLEQWLVWEPHFTRLDAAPPPLTLEEADHIANIFAAYPIDPCEDVNLAIRKQAEWLRDYINNRNRKDNQ